MHSQSLNLRQLSQLHHMIYLAGFRYKHETRERRHGHDTADPSVRNKKIFYKRKEREHEMKGNCVFHLWQPFCYTYSTDPLVYELQKQLCEIKCVMTNLRRNETCRTKKERILMDAYQMLNAGENKACTPEPQVRHVERCVRANLIIIPSYLFLCRISLKTSTRSTNQVPSKCNHSESPEFRQWDQ